MSCDGYGMATTVLTPAPPLMLRLSHVCPQGQRILPDNDQAREAGQRVVEPDRAMTGEPLASPTARKLQNACLLNGPVGLHRRIGRRVTSELGSPGSPHNAAPASQPGRRTPRQRRARLSLRPDARPARPCRSGPSPARSAESFGDRWHAERRSCDKGVQGGFAGTINLPPARFVVGDASQA